MERLKKHGINCLQPKRIMISGKTRVQCFDKTGTLTKDGLDIVGFQPVRECGFFGAGAAAPTHPGGLCMPRKAYEGGPMPAHPHPQAAGDKMGAVLHPADLDAAHVVGLVQGAVRGLVKLEKSLFFDQFDQLWAHPGRRRGPV